MKARVFFVRTMRLACLALVLLFAAGASGAAEILLIKGGNVATAANGILPATDILVRDGRIVALGPVLQAPAGAAVVEAAGRWVFPGFIDGLTNLGAVERGTLGRDDDEATSPLTPHLRITDAFNPANDFLKTAWQLGTTAVFAAPAPGNLLGGQGAVIRLSGATLEDMTVKAPAAVCGSLGEPVKMRYGPKNQMPQTRMGAAALLRQTLIEAREYLARRDSYEKKAAEFENKAREGKAGDEAAPAPPARNAKMEALIPLLEGRLPLVLHAQRMDDVLTALRIADEFGLRLIIAGGAEAAKVKERLAERKVPVLLRPRDAFGLALEAEGATFESARELARAGVLFAFQTGSAASVGDLIPQAQAALAHGLTYQDVFRALTVNPARIFGVASEIGSLEPGRRADVVLYDRDPLRGPSRVRAVFIGGRLVAKEN
jgi:imidazolonepropionase-like amidohydrolase